MCGMSKTDVVALYSGKRGIGDVFVNRDTACLPDPAILLYTVFIFLILQKICHGYLYYIIFHLMWIVNEVTVYLIFANSLRNLILFLAGFVGHNHVTRFLCSIFSSEVVVFVFQITMTKV